MTEALKQLLRSALFLVVVFGLSPVPASRLRLGRGKRVFYAKTYSNWRKAASEYVDEVKKSTNAPLIIIVECEVARAKTSKLVWPRGDVDNYAKPPLDMLNTIAYADDDQVLGLWVTKWFAATPEDAKTSVSIYEVPRP